MYCWRLVPPAVTTQPSGVSAPRRDEVSLLIYPLAAPIGSFMSPSGPPIFFFFRGGGRAGREAAGVFTSRGAVSDRDVQDMHLKELLQDDKTNFTRVWYLMSY